MIKYQHALDQAGLLINIDKLSGLANKHKSYYKCISCGNELIPKLGKIKQHHFAHKTTLVCSKETYLHKLGKRVFYDEYALCLKSQLPFIIGLRQEKRCVRWKNELNITCFKNEPIEYDLTKIYDTIELEKHDGEYIPDVLLLSSDGRYKLYIEIAVSHFSSEKKLQSRVKLIEFSVQTEEDLIPIKRHKIIENENNAFHHFKREKEEVLCVNGCTKSFDFFVVESDGRSILYQKKLEGIFLYLQDKEPLHYEISKNKGNHGNKYKYLIAKSYSKNIKVQNCFLCKYFADNNWLENIDGKKNPVFCKILKEPCNSQKAIGCKHYRVSRDFVNEYQYYNELFNFELDPNKPDNDIDEDNWF